MTEGRFTKEQRLLFDRIAQLIRSEPREFEEAGAWLDSAIARPILDRNDWPTDLDRVFSERVRQRVACVREEMRRNMRAWHGNLMSRMPAEREAASRPFDSRQVLGWYPVMPARILTRATLVHEACQARKEAAKPLTREEAVQAVLERLLQHPTNYDRLRPELKVREAHRVLLVTWILTDSGDLRTDPPLTQFQDWPWGDHELQFLVQPGEKGRLAVLFLHLQDVIEPWTAECGRAMALIPDNSPSAEASSSNGEPAGPSYVFCLAGEFWEIRFDAENGFFADCAGLRVIAKLLRFPNPSRPLTAMELLGRDSNDNCGEHTYNEMFGREEVRQCQDRLRELNADIQEANDTQNFQKAIELETERDQIRDNLRKGHTLKGKPRHIGAASPAKLAGNAVRNSVNRAFKGLAKWMPKLASHLKSSIEIGETCSYRPATPAPTWKIT